MGGKAERRLHFRHGPPPPPPRERGTQSHGCGPLACQVLPTGRRVAGGSQGLGPWPDPPPPVPHSTPAGVVHARTRTPAPPGLTPGTHLGRGVVRGLARWPQGQPQ